MCKNTMYFAHSRCVRTLRTLYVYATGYLCVPVETESQSYMEYTHVLNYRVKATFHYFSQLQTWSKTWSQAGRKHVESQLRVRTCLKRVFFLHSICLSRCVCDQVFDKKSRKLVEACRKPAWTCRKPGCKPGRKPGFQPGLQLVRIMECGLNGA